MTCLKKLIKELNKYAKEAEHTSLGKSEYLIIITLPGRNNCCEANKLPNNDIAIAIEYHHYYPNSYIFITKMTLSRFVWGKKKNWLGMNKYKPVRDFRTINLKDEGGDTWINKNLIKLINKVERIQDQFEKEGREIMRKKRINDFCAGVKL